MNISNLIESISTSFDRLILSTNYKNSNAHLQLITVIAVGALTLVSAGALFWRRRLTAYQEAVASGATQLAIIQAHLDAAIGDAFALEDFGPVGGAATNAIVFRPRKFSKRPLNTF